MYASVAADSHGRVVAAEARISISYSLYPRKIGVKGWYLLQPSRAECSARHE